MTRAGGARPALVVASTLLLALPAWAQRGKPKGGGTDPDLANPYTAPAASAPPAAAAAPTDGADPDAAAPPAPSAAAPVPPAGAPPRAADDVDTRASAMAAYQAALGARKLAAAAPLSRERLREELDRAEQKLASGRRDEAIGDLVYVVESPRFTPFRSTPEGQNARFLLGDALGRAGAHAPARGYLRALLSLGPDETWFRRAARSLVELGLDSDQPESFLKDLQTVPSSAPEEIRSDIAYLEGRAHERMQRPTHALAAYARVTPRSRFWAQATYLAGLIEVDRGRLKRGEQQFCKIADARRTPKQAVVFGGGDFFRVRDLARLGLGRIAHEQYRFDDSRYYYYLVPRDSDQLPEALYESATSRYEAKDYGAARDLLDELGALERSHAYQDEAWLLDAYVDLATCEFGRADRKLVEFLRRYEPVRDAARRLRSDRSALGRLLEAVRTGADPAAAGAGVPAATARSIGALLRLDAGWSAAALRLARLDHQLSGLRGAMSQLDDVRRRLATPEELRPAGAAALAGSPERTSATVDAQLAEIRRLLREAGRASRVDVARVAELQKELEALELRARAARAVEAAPAAGEGTDLASLVVRDRERAAGLHGDAQQLRAEIVQQQDTLAGDALARLDRRLTRLLQRARLGRIETVLGKKRALEIEVEALTQGLLPRRALDSLDAARYLRDDEEYWPFDGEDWHDEYVGGEGLR
jgi:hypothetical protein